MRFSQHLSVSDLASLCRVLKISLDAGLRIDDVFAQQAKRGAFEVRPIAARIARRLARGVTLVAALRKESAFPPLFMAMAEVGEESGHLTEVFTALEEYYSLQQQIRRRFRAGILMPAIQFFIAILVIAVVIWVLGMLAQSRGGPGGILGLSGASGAFVFLGAVVGTLLLVVFGGRLVLQRLQGKYVLDALVLRLPVIGDCAQSLAMARFTLAMYLTMESGMLLGRAIRLSLQATGNAAFEAQADPIDRELRHGENLTLAITGAWVFPHEFRHILAVAEESGRLPESMRQQCLHFQEEGERRVKTLMQLATWMVWLVYAVFVIIMIFQLAGVYFSALPQ